MLRSAGLLLALALPAFAFSLVPVAAQEPEFDQVPYADKQWELGRRMDESEFRYCIDQRDPDWEVAGEIADAIAQALLLEPKRYMVESQIVIEDITKVYGVMLEHCDAYMGFKLIPDAYPDWATVTRAYYEGRYDYITSDPAIHALADLPPLQPIVATGGTAAHYRLMSYIFAQPAEARWPVFPMGTNELALDSVLNGTARVGLVWTPSLWARQQSDAAYAKLQVIDPRPLPATTLGVGALMLSNNTFLRAAVDQAIAALIADGTIEHILEQHKFPATAQP